MAKRSRKNIQIKWQHNEQCWLAIDLDRPGCCAVDTNKTRLWRELRDAQDAWDQARAQVETEITKSLSCVDH